MLIGPPFKPQIPDVPDESAGIQGIFQYLHDLDTAVTYNYSSIVLLSVGMIGAIGISSTGTLSQNFIRILDIGNVCSISWIFTGIEADTSYMILHDTTPMPSWNSLNALPVRVTKNTTSVDFSFSGIVPTGTLLSMIMLR